MSEASSSNHHGSTSSRESSRYAPPGSPKRAMNRFRMSHHSGLSIAPSSRSSPPTRRNRFHMSNHSGLLAPSFSKQNRSSTLTDHKTEVTDATVASNVSEANENRLDAKELALESSTSDENSFGSSHVASIDNGEHVIENHLSAEPRMSIIDSLLFSETNNAAERDEQNEDAELSVGNVSSPCAQQKADCPICFSKMHSSDLIHPLQCPTNTCNFNFCRSCVEGLIVSSKDDYQLASDGNMHVKVHLRCPSCRSDLSSTIRDTVLLRKAHYVQDISNAGILTVSERRMKCVLDCCDVQDALHSAQLREKCFFEPTQSDPVTHDKRDSEISPILLHTSSHDEGHAHVELDLDADSELILVKPRTRHSRNRSSMYQLIDEAKEVRARHRAKASIQRAAAAVRRGIRRLSLNDDQIDNSRHSLRDSLRARREDRQRSTNEQRRNSRREHRGSLQRSIRRSLHRHGHANSGENGIFDWFSDLFVQSTSCTTEL